MSSFTDRFSECLDRPVGGWSRVFLILFIFVFLPAFVAPLWRIHMIAPQYPKGLTMDIYLNKLVGGNEGRDIAEINQLNHYIGMRTIQREEVPELDWIPFVFGVLLLLQLRAATIGNGRSLIDVTVLNLFAYMFVLGRFVYKLYVFGHYLDPTAPVNIEPFMPVVVGVKQIANFTTYSFPLWGSACVAANALCVIVILLLHFRPALFGRREIEMRKSQVTEGGAAGELQ